MFGAVRHFLSIFSDPSVTWAGLSFLRENTRLPIVLKGILHPDDARRAVDHGVDGILVSNHGGRQVDGAIAALEALCGVVDAVPESLPVLFDSGVRSAADAFVALALGARAVLLGRPYIWALGIGGEAGVTEFLRGFLAELDLTFALSGHTRVDQVGRGALVPTPEILTDIDNTPGPGYKGRRARGASASRRRRRGRVRWPAERGGTSMSRSSPRRRRRRRRTTTPVGEIPPGW